MKFVRARKDAHLEGLHRLPAMSNYFFGQDPERWRTDIPNYAKVRISGLYPGIDAVYYASQGQLEYDLVIHPGADPSRIRLAVKGAQELHIDENGDLLVRTAAGEIRQHAPAVYQQTGRVRENVAGRYEITGASEVRLRLGRYDPTKPLTIDPVLAFSTYLGGSGIDVGNAITVDREGKIYVTGRTTSNDFPTLNPLQPARAGARDVFVTKLDQDGQLVYSTYIGGSGAENPLSIAVDELGQAYVTGVTASPNFPTHNAFQSVFAGGGQDGFVLKLSAAGDQLLYSTYLGGPGFDQSRSIAVDRLGFAYVTGNADLGFPTKNPIQACTGIGAFIAKLSQDGSGLVFSTCLHGSAFFESGRGIAVDGGFHVYVAGETRSTDFPTTPGAFQTSFGGGTNDLFVVKLSADGSRLLYSTYLGGSGDDQSDTAFGDSGSIHGHLIAIDDDGNAYITGDTSSTDFPTRNAFQSAHGSGPFSAFVTKLNSDGSALVYSTYLGGSGFDSGRSIAVDEKGHAYVVGAAGSIDFPLRNALQTTFGGGDYDAFVAKLSRSGRKLLFSSYLGGSGTDVAWNLALGPEGQISVVGQTASLNFPTKAALQANFAGGPFDGFIAQIARGQNENCVDE
jgi:hypothetical protein